MLRCPSPLLTQTFSRRRIQATRCERYTPHLKESCKLCGRKPLRTGAVCVLCEWAGFVLVTEAREECCSGSACRHARLCRAGSLLVAACRCWLLLATAGISLDGRCLGLAEPLPLVTTPQTRLPLPDAPAYKPLIRQLLPHSSGGSHPRASGASPPAAASAPPPIGERSLVLAAAPAACFSPTQPSSRARRPH